MQTFLILVVIAKYLLFPPKILITFQSRARNNEPLHVQVFLSNINFIHKYSWQWVYKTKTPIQTHLLVVYLLHVSFVTMFYHTDIEFVKISFILFFFARTHVPSYPLIVIVFHGTVQVSQVWYFSTSRPNHSFTQN